MASDIAGKQPGRAGVARGVSAVTSLPAAPPAPPGPTDRPETAGTPPSDVRFADVVVIGAGQAGLSAAYHLRRRGFVPAAADPA